jgi:hypothetical protein
MSGDVHVRICERLGVKLPRATRPVVHCSSQLQAQWKLKAIVERLEQCGLRLNLEKTAIVYCKDSDRQEAHAHKQITFLGTRSGRAKRRIATGSCSTAFYRR